MKLLFVMLLMVAVTIGEQLNVDMNGYILYCPCMGRFGNQADQFLGAMAFAKGLNRTLVLPPWVEYKPMQTKSVQIPFKTYFNVEAVNEYHRAITMDDFMAQLAGKLWPIGKRVSYCYSARQGEDLRGCNAKDGNPFRSFWDTFSIDFDSSKFYGPVDFNPKNAQEWIRRFPVKQHPILAFTGAPGAFPVLEQHVELHKYMRWSAEINTTADEYIAANIERPYIGIHMRNGVDFKRACEHVESSRGRNLFGSAQCLGYRNEFGDLSNDLCFPPETTVIKQLKKAVKKLKAKTVYIATDDNTLINQFQKNIKKVKFVTLFNKMGYGPTNSPHVDLAILGKADHYIGNCVSTFSAFAARERRATGKSVEFWAFHIDKKHRLEDEL